MSDKIKQLEQRIDDMIALCKALTQENVRIKSQLDSIVRTQNVYETDLNTAREKLKIIIQNLQKNV